MSLCAVGKPKDIKLRSPHKTLQVNIAVDHGQVGLKLKEFKEVLLVVEVGRFVFDQKVVWGQYGVQAVNHVSEREQWQALNGERNTINDCYNEVEIVFGPENEADYAWKLICRAYDEGVAFRYEFGKAMAEDLHLQKELTSFKFTGDYLAWVADKAQAAYRKESISNIDGVCERPLVIERNKNSYLALGEAALVDYARMKLRRGNSEAFSFVVELDGEVDLKTAGYKSPWRYVMVAESPVELLENNFFIQNLNEPNKLEDTSWIKPGKVIREVTLTTQGGLACVDFAARHNLQYVEFDAGWYGNEYDDSSDATTITVDPRRSPGPLDLHKVIDYADKQDIGIILYVNRRALETQLDEVLPLLKKWGVKGIKYGFVNVGPQKWTSWLHNAIRKAAKYELMVDVHDEYRPTGYSRTYPNLITQEGIRGDEESPSVEQSLITLFTRMIAGAGDNTNCYQASRVSEKMGGKAAQMAKAVMLFSPWQFVYWYDRPEGSPCKKGGAGAAQSIIKEGQELTFYDALPTVWDDTKVLEGKIGEYATIARRNGEDWFIGSLVSNQNRSVEISLDFLDEEDTYEAVIFSQDAKSQEDNEVQIKKIKVTSDSVLNMELLKNSGFTIIIRKI